MAAHHNNNNGKGTDEPITRILKNYLSEKQNQVKNMNGNAASLPPPSLPEDVLSELLSHLSSSSSCTSSTKGANVKPHQEKEWLDDIWKNYIHSNQKVTMTMDDDDDDANTEEKEEKEWKSTLSLLQILLLGIQHPKQADNINKDDETEEEVIAPHLFHRIILEWSSSLFHRKSNHNCSSNQKRSIKLCLLLATQSLYMIWKQILHDVKQLQQQQQQQQQQNDKAKGTTITVKWKRIGSIAMETISLYQRLVLCPLHQLYHSRTDDADDESITKKKKIDGEIYQWYMSISCYAFTSYIGPQLIQVYNLFTSSCCDDVKKKKDVKEYRQNVSVVLKASLIGTATKLISFFGAAHHDTTSSFSSSWKEVTKFLAQNIFHQDCDAGMTLFRLDELLLHPMRCYVTFYHLDNMMKIKSGRDFDDEDDDYYDDKDDESDYDDNHDEKRNKDTIEYNKIQRNAQNFTHVVCFPEHYRNDEDYDVDVDVGVGRGSSPAAARKIKRIRSSNKIIPNELNTCWNELGLAILAHYIMVVIPKIKENGEMDASNHVCFPTGVYSPWYTWSMFYPHVIRLLEEEEKMQEKILGGNDNSSNGRPSFLQMGIELLQTLFSQIPAPFSSKEVATIASSSSSSGSIATLLKEQSIMKQQHHKLRQDKSTMSSTPSPPSPTVAAWYYVLYNKDIFGPIGSFHTIQLLFNRIISMSQKKQQQQQQQQPALDSFSTTSTTVSDCWQITQPQLTQLAQNLMSRYKIQYQVKTIEFLIKRCPYPFVIPTILDLIRTCVFETFQKEKMMVIEEGMDTTIKEGTQDEKREEKEIEEEEFQLLVLGLLHPYLEQIGNHMTSTKKSQSLQQLQLSNTYDMMQSLEIYACCASLIRRLLWITTITTTKIQGRDINQGEMQSNNNKKTKKQKDASIAIEQALHIMKTFYNVLKVQLEIWSKNDEDVNATESSSSSELDYTPPPSDFFKLYLLEDSLEQCLSAWEEEKE